MMIESKNFHMILGDGDGLCLGQVETNYNKDTGEYPQLVVGKEFLIEVANFALLLAERNLLNKITMTQKKDLETLNQLLYGNHVEEKDLLSIKDRLELLTNIVGDKLKHYK